MFFGKMRFTVLKSLSALFVLALAGCDGGCNYTAKDLENAAGKFGEKVGKKVGEKLAEKACEIAD